MYEFEDVRIIVVTFDAANESTARNVRITDLYERL